MSAVWTDERLNLLKRKVREKKSARITADEINTETGSDYSRSAVIGKARRLGISFLSQAHFIAIPKRPVSAELRRPYKPSRRPPRPGRVTPPELRKPPRQILEPLPGASMLEQLMVLQSHHCRWIEDGRYCGAVTTRAPYCDMHRKVSLP